MDDSSWMAFLAGRLPELWLRTGQHLMLTGVAIGLAISIGVPLGAIASRVRWIRTPILSTAGILQTIPSLAMLTLLLAFLHRIGALPAIVALTLYALLPIVRNTLTGLEGVSSEVMEAARGIGMSGWQEMRMVRMPLALPVIVAGVRTAAVTSVGIATLSAFIGAGGLGQFINRGLALANTRLILLGAIPAALLAVMVDLSFGTANWALNPRRRTGRRTLGMKLARGAALFLPLALFAAGGLSYARTRPDIILGSKPFTEQLILGHMIAQVIEDHSGLQVDRRFCLGGTMICHGALRNGEIDLYPEYTGTGFTTVLHREPIPDPDRVYGIVSEEYRRRFHAEWLAPFGINNTYTITVRERDAEENGWKKISDLAASASNLRAGFTAEFSERKDGYLEFPEAYGFQFGEVKDLDPSIMYDAVAKGQVDVISAFATDGRIAAFELKPLADDMRYFPPYYAAPVIRQATLETYPEIRELLTALGNILDDAAMQRLNLQVDQEKRSPGEVAREFLISRGILKEG